MHWALTFHEGGIDFFCKRECSNFSSYLFLQMSTQITKFIIHTYYSEILIQSRQNLNILDWELMYSYDKDIYYLVNFYELQRFSCLVFKKIVLSALWKYSLFSSRSRYVLLFWKCQSFLIDDILIEIFMVFLMFTNVATYLYISSYQDNHRCICSFCNSFKCMYLVYKSGEKNLDRE